MQHVRSHMARALDRAGAFAAGLMAFAGCVGIGVSLPYALGLVIRVAIEGGR